MAPNTYQQQRDVRTPGPDDRKSKTILALTGLAAATGLAAYLLWPSMVVVPSVEGMSRTQAQHTLASKDLGSRPEMRDASGVPLDTVVPGTQNPPAGAQVKRDTVITFAVNATERTARRPVLPQTSTTTTTTSDVNRAAAPQPVRVVEKPVIRTIEKPVIKVVEKPVIRTIEKPVAVVRTVEKPVYIDRTPSRAPERVAVASPAATPDLSRASTTIASPRNGQEISCDTAGTCTISVKGKSGATPDAGHLLVWWRPVTGGNGWHLISDPGLQLQASGAFSGTVSLSDGQFTPRDGETVDLAVTVADDDTYNRLSAEGTDATHDQPEGAQTATVSGLTIAMR